MIGISIDGELKEADFQARGIEHIKAQHCSASARFRLGLWMAPLTQSRPLLQPGPLQDLLCTPPGLRRFLSQQLLA